MELYQAPPRPLLSKRVAGYVAAIVIAGGGLTGYTVHEHHVAQSLQAENQQIAADLSATRDQINDLNAKVASLATRLQSQPAPAGEAASASRTIAVRRRGDSTRIKKLQNQLDEQGKAITATRDDLEATQGDLSNTRTELTGSIARTHDDLVLLQKKGERNYYEFDIEKSKQFSHSGPFGIRLKKANTKHQYADLELMVDDRDLSQKHVNLYQPIMFYTSDQPMAAELVINSIGKDHIHGYVSAPKYRQSELASASASSAAGGTTSATANAAAQPAERQKLPVPQ